MAIPLSVISRHFAASYDLLNQKQQIRGRALQHFAKTNRKSSAFVVREIIGRRFSAVNSKGAFTRPNSVLPMTANGAARSSRNNNRTYDMLSAFHDNRDSIIDVVPMSKEQEAQLRTIANFKKEIELTAAIKKKTVSDGRALVGDYQMFAKWVLVSLKTVSQNMLDKQSRKTVRKTIRQSIHAVGNGLASTLRSSSNEDGGEKAERKKVASESTGGGQKRGSVLGSIRERRNENMAEGNNAEDDEEEDSESDDEDDDEEDDDDDDAEEDASEGKRSVEDIDDDDFDLQRPKLSPINLSARRPSALERRQSSVRSDLSTVVLDSMVTKLLELVDKLVRQHVPHGSNLRNLLELNTDFEDDANILLDIFRSHLEECSATETESSKDNKAGKQLREEEMLERLTSATWGTDDNSYSGTSVRNHFSAAVGKFTAKLSVVADDNVR
jgi:hypothetical protein